MQCALNYTKQTPLQTDRRGVERSMHDNLLTAYSAFRLCIPDTTANDRTAVSALVTYSLMALCGGVCCTAASTASALCSASWACICSVEMHTFAYRPYFCSKLHFDAHMLARLRLQALWHCSPTVCVGYISDNPAGGSLQGWTQTLGFNLLELWKVQLHMPDWT